MRYIQIRTYISRNNSISILAFLHAFSYACGFDQRSQVFPSITVNHFENFLSFTAQEIKKGSGINNKFSLVAQRALLYVMQNFKAVNFFTTEVPIIKKPVHWFALQMNGLVSIMIWTSAMKKLRLSRRKKKIKDNFTCRLIESNGL